MTSSMYGEKGDTTTPTGLRCSRKQCGGCGAIIQNPLLQERQRMPFSLTFSLTERDGNWLVKTTASQKVLPSMPKEKYSSRIFRMQKLTKSVLTEKCNCTFQIQRKPAVLHSLRPAKCLPLLADGQSRQQKKCIDTNHPMAIPSLPAKLQAMT